MSRLTRVGLLALAAAAASGCFTHRCRVPTPVVEAAPGPRLPGAVEVRYLPPAASAERVEEIPQLFPPNHRVVVNADAPTRALFDRLAASMFERTAPPGEADVVLEVRLERFQVGVVPFSHTASEVAYRGTLRTRAGAEIASFDVAGASSVAGTLRHVGFCGARGDAVAVAMQGAGAELVRQASGDPAIAVWLAARGSAPVALRVKPLEAYADPPAAPSEAPTPTTAATASPTPSRSAARMPRPVDAGPPPEPLPPRSLRLRAGGAAFQPRSTSGKLEGPSTGVSVTPFAAEARVSPGLRVDVDVDFDARSYSASHVPHLTGFGPRATLDGWTAGLGLRWSPPLGERPPLEPWLGASARVLYTKLAVTYFGGASGGDATDTAWSVGADLGAGLNLFFAGPWMLGFDVRWRFGRASLAPLGAVDVGGLLVGGSLGAAFP